MLKHDLPDDRPTLGRPNKFIHYTLKDCAFVLRSFRFVNKNAFLGMNQCVCQGMKGHDVRKVFAGSILQTTAHLFSSIAIEGQHEDLVRPNTAMLMQEKHP